MCFGAFTAAAAAAAASRRIGRQRERHTYNHMRSQTGVKRQNDTIRLF